MSAKDQKKMKDVMTGGLGAPGGPKGGGAGQAKHGIKTSPPPGDNAPSTP